VVNLATSKGIVLKNKTIKVEEVVGMDVAVWAEETAEEMAEVRWTMFNHIIVELWMWMRWWGWAWLQCTTSNSSSKHVKLGVLAVGARWLSVKIRRIILAKSAIQKTDFGQLLVIQWKALIDWYS
jgi:hypothetical protein